MIVPGIAPVLAPADPLGSTFGGAGGLWWRSGDWTIELGDRPLGFGDPRTIGMQAPTAGEARRRRLAARRSIGREWARDLVREHLGGVWPGFREHRPGEKPRLRGDRGIDVSIAHSGASMLVAIAHGALVGADIESAPFEAFGRVQLVRRMCSPEELAGFAHVEDGPLRRRMLARAWTVKEAVLKARGVGLAVDPRSVVVDVAAIFADVGAWSASTADAADADAAGRPEMSVVRLSVGTGEGPVYVVHPQGGARPHPPG